MMLRICWTFPDDISKEQKAKVERFLKARVWEMM